MHYFLRFNFGIKLCIFQTVPLSIIRSFSLYTRQWCMSYRFTDNLWAGSGWNCSQAFSKPVWHMPLRCVQWKNSWWWTEELSEKSRFYSKNKFENLVHLVGFIVRIYHDAVTW